MEQPARLAPAQRIFLLMAATAQCALGLLPLWAWSRPPHVERWPTFGRLPIPYSEAVALVCLGGGFCTLVAGRQRWAAALAAGPLAVGSLVLAQNAIGRD